MDSKQTSDKAQTGPGVALKTLTPRDSGVRVGVPGGASGENSEPGNRNKKS